jgi:hypothetical protein
MTLDLARVPATVGGAVPLSPADAAVGIKIPTATQALALTRLRHRRLPITPTKAATLTVNAIATTAQENANNAKKMRQRRWSEEDRRRRSRNFRPPKSWQFQVGAHTWRSCPPQSLWNC